MVIDNLPIWRLQAKIMQMHDAEISEYLNILSLFYSVAELTRIVGVTRPTMQSWLDGKTLPNTKYREQFENALDRLVNFLDKHSEIGRQIADVIEPPPMSLKGNRQLLLSMLPARDQKIYDALYPMTRKDIRRLADSLFVFEYVNNRGRTIWKSTERTRRWLIKRAKKNLPLVILEVEAARHRISPQELEHCIAKLGLTINKGVVSL